MRIKDAEFMTFSPFPVKLAFQLKFCSFVKFCGSYFTVERLVAGKNENNGSNF